MLGGKVVLQQRQCESEHELAAALHHVCLRRLQAPQQRHAPALVQEQHAAPPGSGILAGSLASHRGLKRVLGIHRRGPHVSVSSGSASSGSMDEGVMSRVCVAWWWYATRCSRNATSSAPASLAKAIAPSDPGRHGAPLGSGECGVRVRGGRETGDLSTSRGWLWIHMLWQWSVCSTFDQRGSLILIPTPPSNQINTVATGSADVMMLPSWLMLI
jgi:hypothetical protein